VALLDPRSSVLHHGASPVPASAAEFVPMATPIAHIDEAQPPRFVAVEGPIGVGKTTLARRLSETFRHPILIEPAAENPFLDRFYREGGRHALPTQLYFLLHRARQLAELGDGGLFHPVVVADFLIQKDRLFAEITLDANELHLYDQIYRTLAISAPNPDLVVYLQAPADVLIERIRRRGIASEQHITASYLEALIDAYTRFFHFYDDAPLLIVNAAEIDFVNNDAHYEQLVSRILHMSGMRQYFNPHPTMI
jgi:deoxyguanosine kinase